jgi:hypothetical protein
MIDVDIKKPFILPSMSAISTEISALVPAHPNKIVVNN